MAHGLDDSIPEDVRAVLEAAALLDVTEFEVFWLGYRRWYGRSPSSARIENEFAAYMFNDRVPLWARHFARLVGERAASGHLDPAALGVEALERKPGMVARGVRYMVAVSASTIALLVLGEAAARLLGLGERCMFPPCY